MEERETTSDIDEAEDIQYFSSANVHTGHSATRAYLRALKRKADNSNTIQYVGLAATLGGVVAKSLTTNSFGTYSIYTGIAFTLLGIIYSAATYSKIMITPHPDPSVRDKHFRLRNTTMMGALIAATGSMVLLVTQCSQQGSLPLGNFSYLMLGAISVGLGIMVVSALLGQEQSITAKIIPKKVMDKMEKKDKKEIKYLYRSYFFGQSATLTGTLVAGTGVVLMRTGMWSPGVNILLAGVGLMLVGTMVREALTITVAKFTSDKKIQNDDLPIDKPKDTKGRTVGLIGTIPATGGGIALLHESLSSPSSQISLSSASMIAFMIGIGICLMGYGYSACCEATPAATQKISQ